MLVIRDVSKQYGRKTAVRGLDLQVESGRLVALLGPNGSGKTTLMKMIAGLIRPTKGEIRIDGDPVGVKSKRHVAYMPTEAFFYNYMTAMDAGRYYRDFFRDFDMEKYLRTLESDNLDPKQKIRAMSSGMMAKLKLALTFARDSRLVMLDEPLNGIDIIAREKTLRAIDENRASNRVLIVSSHLVDELEEMIDEAVFLKDGEIVLSGDARKLRSERGESIVDMYRRIYGESEAGQHA